MWNWLPPQLTSRLFDSRRSQWIVRPRVTRDVTDPDLAASSGEPASPRSSRTSGP